MRVVFTLLHRWIGLTIATFLIFSGLTGAVISWDHELDEVLNPHLTHAATEGPAQDALKLAQQIEVRYPQMQVLSTQLAAEPGHSLVFYLEPRVDPATGKLFEATFNQVYVDPASGQELGKRNWGAVWPITRETFVSFLYRLHYTLHMPELWGTDLWGVWLLGIVSLVWTIDCFIGLYLTFPQRRRKALRAASATATSRALADDAVDDEALPEPALTELTPAAVAAGAHHAARKNWWARWQPAWKIRWQAGPIKLNFDLHRAISLWTWGVLFIVAFTAFSQNLYREVFFPVMSLMSNVTPTPFDLRTPADRNQPIAWTYSPAQALEVARAEATRRGWDEPAGNIFYARSFGLYGVAFYAPEDEHGAGGVGHRELYIDGRDGRIVGDQQPWTGTAADIFVQAQFPLHSGRILGLPGRILISLTGLVVAMLSVTGVILWWRKRAGRLAARPAAKDVALASDGVMGTPQRDVIIPALQRRRV